ncbi:MAG: hypothetical protein V2I33_25820, partial [Kangiellaceae bacterium]|nr:hypothetical protein [Kangiellaceae bacterium]
GCPSTCRYGQIPDNYGDCDDCPDEDCSDLPCNMELCETCEYGDVEACAICVDNATLQSDGESCACNDGFYQDTDRDECFACPTPHCA